MVLPVDKGSAPTSTPPHPTPHKGLWTVTGRHAQLPLWTGRTLLSGSWEGSHQGWGKGPSKIDLDRQAGEEGPFLNGWPFILHVTAMVLSACLS